MVQKIEPAQAIRLLDAGQACAVDVREPEEYALGHILGSVLLPLDSITAATAAEAMPDKEATWLVYCRTGRRSYEAVQKLSRLGYTQLRDLGGVMSWPYELESDY